ncbi:MAG: hypothetical protein JW991_03875, partial [Candidatus Pacebacteria bacterium]|nr:hypothetical protein [Candidatus Paceibacterota bacterium]
DEIEYHSSATKDLNQRAEQLKQRLDRLYDDKLDGKIKPEFYERKFRQYSEELENTSSSLDKYNRASVSYFELGMNIYELSQRAKQVYLKAESEEDKRKLIRLVFGRLTLDEGKIDTVYSPAFKLLSEAVEHTNSSKVAKTHTIEDRIFEPQEKIDILGKYEYSEPYRSALLPGSPFVLYDIFSGESLARVKNQLDVLKKVLVSEPKYAVVKVSNGEFVKL